MTRSEINHAIFDLDGCLSSGSRFRKDPPLDFSSESPTVERFLEYMRAKPVRRSVATGRSLAITKALIDWMMNDLSVLEHGTVLYDPNVPDEHVQLVDDDESYASIREAKEALEKFIAGYQTTHDDAIVTSIASGFRIHRRGDNLHILTYGVDPKERPNSEILREILHNEILPEKLKVYISEGKLIELVSKEAYDLLPAVSKKAGVERVVKVRKLDPSRTLIVGDSYHSDGPMMELFDGMGYMV